ncbi:MAG: fibronectin type III domain-containing protein [Flavobacteriales bacterium]|nr:fibronectin type III domain-containing protein [Flavobacteriales bacterium]
MRRILIVLLALLPGLVLGQDSPQRVSQRIQSARTLGAFTPVGLFQAVPESPATRALWANALRASTVLRFDVDAAQALLQARHPFIAFELTSDRGTEILDLELRGITAEGFGVRVSSTGDWTEVPAAVHYRGVVRGVPGSLAAISVFEKEVMGLIGDAQGDRVLGRLADDDEGMHVFYHEVDLRGTFNPVCGTPDLDLNERPEPRGEGGAKTMRCVNLYWEAAYDLFQNKGSVANVTTYLTGLFNQVSTLLDNDGVDVLLSEIFVWNTASPYPGPSSSNKLSQFGQVRTSFNGNLAHLIDLGGTGGVAWLNSLCGGTSSRMAYSGINTTFQNVPTYSWSVEVVTHETGHNLGSSHTHACVWNGDNTAIDGCGPAAGYTEGSCPQAPVPPSSVGGTIMSYCHLVSAGIKFANGFGPQPGLRIRERVNASSCLGMCGTTCDAPTPLSVTNLNATAATLNWANYGAVSYTLRWKPVSSGTWTTLTGLTATTYGLTGLTQNVQYEFQVLCVCTASSSAYSASRQFTTPVPCPEAYEPNGTTGTAPTVTLPATINALIATNGDVDYYRFTIAATSTISLFLGNLPADYELRLLNGAGSTLANSTNGGTTSEYISYPNAAAGTYFVRVIGFSGAFNASQCYLLTINAVVTTCNVPQGIQVSSITWNSASVSWSGGQPGGSTTYDLRWKPSSLTSWNTVSGIAASPYSLTGLDPLTSYDVQVRAVCGGLQGITSDWSSTVVFTTLQAPCEVVPRSVVAAKVFLEGAYRQAAGLMADSLRKLNLLPLTEPYTAMGHTISGPTTTSPSVFSVTGSNAVVDWVLVEVRQNSSPHAVLEARAGLVQRDGDVVAPDGVSPLGFCQNAGTYRVAVRHRNHLGVMTGTGYALSGTSTAVNLTVSGTATYGSGARKTVGSIVALWAGNVDANHELKYTGQDNDRDPILLAVGGSVPTNTVVVYSASDVNMDGTVKYIGQDNDRDPILSNVGGSVPTNTLPQQLP